MHSELVFFEVQTMLDSENTWPRHINQSAGRSARFEDILSLRVLSFQVDFTLLPSFRPMTARHDRTSCGIARGRDGGKCPGAPCPCARGRDLEGPSGPGKPGFVLPCLRAREDPGTERPSSLTPRVVSHAVRPRTDRVSPARLVHVALTA